MIQDLIAIFKNPDEHEIITKVIPLLQTFNKSCRKIRARKNKHQFKESDLTEESPPEVLRPSHKDKKRKV